MTGTKFYRVLKFSGFLDYGHQSVLTESTVVIFSTADEVFVSAVRNLRRLMASYLGFISCTEDDCRWCSQNVCCGKHDIELRPNRRESINSFVIGHVSLPSFLMCSPFIWQLEMKRQQTVLSLCLCALPCVQRCTRNSAVQHRLDPRQRTLKWRVFFPWEDDCIYWFVEVRYMVENKISQIIPRISSQGNSHYWREDSFFIYIFKDKKEINWL